MRLLGKVEDEISNFVLKIASNKFRDRLNYKPRQIKTVEISESFFKKDKFFGNLYLKSLLEYNRIGRQQIMLESSKCNFINYR